MFEKFSKKLKKIILPLVIIFLTISSLVTIFFLIFFENKNSKDYLSSPISILVYSLLIFIAFLIIVFIFITKKEQKNSRKLISKGINYYVENLVSTLSIGIVVFRPNGEILWVSDFIENRFGEKIINKDINFFNKDLDSNKKFVDFQKIFKYDEYVYRLNFVAKEMILVIKDITQEYSATYFYEKEKLVIGEIEIDNYQLFRSSFSDEEIFAIQSYVKNILDELSKKYNFIYKQYMDGKFSVTTNRDNLNKMILSSFKDFEKLDDFKINRMRLSFSVGFGADASSYSQLVEMAKEALYQSQTRGGDQVTVMSSIEKIKRFGSKSEVTTVKSKTKIKNVANNLKIRLQDKKIKNVVIYGHKFSDLDAIGASYALYEIATKFGKKAVIQNITFDHTGKKAIDKYLKNWESIFVSNVKIKSFNKEETIVIIVDCAEDTRVENPLVFNNVEKENLFIFDHHRVSELNDVVDNLNVYIESTASSASEIIVEVIEFNEFQNYISALGAQMLLNGICLDTNQFKKSTSSRTFAAASLLEDWGASVEETLSLMKISAETNEKIIQIISKCKEIKPGYWLSYTSEIIPIDVVSMAADEILKIEGRKAAFVVAQLPKASEASAPIYKLSARSIGVNVQLIAEAVGGGGHFNAAAAVSDAKANETLETFVDNITQAIISSKE